MMKWLNSQFNSVQFAIQSIVIHLIFKKKIVSELLSFFVTLFFVSFFFNLTSDYYNNTYYTSCFFSLLFNCIVFYCNLLVQQYIIV
jgi:hypothetical protein